MPRRRKKGRSNIVCPRCNVRLWVETIKHFGPIVEIDVCRQCGGTWYDKGELKVQVPDSHMRHRLTDFPLVGEESPIACPRCGGMMRLRHEGEVEVDFCTECGGVWLDMGEEEALRYKAEWDHHTEEEKHLKTGAMIAVLSDEYF
jgi:Zn-finger nucleic acid-binding protein